MTATTTRETALVTSPIVPTVAPKGKVKGDKGKKGAKKGTPARTERLTKQTKNGMVSKNPDKPVEGKTNVKGDHRGFCQVDIVEVDGVKTDPKLSKGTSTELTAGGAHKGKVTLPSGTVVTTTQLLTYLGWAGWATSDARTLTVKLGMQICGSTFGCKMGAGRAMKLGDVKPNVPHGHGTYESINTAIKLCKGDGVKLAKLVE